MESKQPYSAQFIEWANAWGIWCSAGELSSWLSRAHGFDIVPHTFADEQAAKSYAEELNRSAAWCRDHLK